MRNIINSAEVSQHTIKLQQLGAKVQLVNSTLCYVNFSLEGLELQYAYNVNYKGNYFLERIKPYPLALQEVSDEKGVVKIISEDVDKFKNALQSNHSQSFISMAQQISRIFTVFEDTFLNYNIPFEKVEKMYKKILALEFEIDMIREISSEIYSEENKDGKSE
ncbi:MAG: hypothetical protein JXN65_03255 [Clostridia bacterium]|nr:hypothetical protein [Clostridia bacterium]